MTRKDLFLYKGKTLEEWLPEAVQRVVEDFDPLKVILFGSLARGEANYHSDADLLVVFDHVERENKRELAVDIRRAIAGVPIPVDVVVTDVDEIGRRGHIVGTVLRPALREGKVVYERSEALRSVLRQWLRYAEDDLRTAEMLQEQGIVPRISCFHAQQAAEKAIKAIFVFLQVDFPFTHDLNRLRDLLPQGWAVKEAFPDLAGLSAWAVEPRYAGDVIEATRRDAEMAIEQAGGLYGMALNELKSRGYRPEDPEGYVQARDTEEKQG